MMASPVLTDVLSSAFAYDLHSVLFWTYSGITLFAVAGSLVDVKERWKEFLDPDEYAYQEWKKKRQRMELWRDRYRADEKQEEKAYRKELFEDADHDIHYAKKTIEDMAMNGDPEACDYLEIDERYDSED